MPFIDLMAFSASLLQCHMILRKF